MPPPISLDLRRRIVRAVERGSSIRAAARRFAVSPSVAIKLMQLADTSADPARQTTHAPRIGARTATMAPTVMSFQNGLSSSASPRTNGATISRTPAVMLVPLAQRVVARACSWFAPEISAIAVLRAWAGLERYLNPAPYAFRQELELNHAVEFMGDAPPEAAPLGGPCLWASGFSPGKHQALRVCRAFEPPAHFDAARRHGQAAVLDRVGREFVQHEIESQSRGGREDDCCPRHDHSLRLRRTIGGSCRFTS
jgi:hypothetical protein